MKFGLVKPAIDAHTLGVSSIAGLLVDSGASVSIAPPGVSIAVEDIRSDAAYATLIKWLMVEDIRVLGLSYRLDPHMAFELFERLVCRLDSDPRTGPIGDGHLRNLIFAGLPEAGDLVQRRYGGRFVVFRGDESPQESLEMIGIPSSQIPSWLVEDSRYDQERLQWATNHVTRGAWCSYPEPAGLGQNGRASSLLSRLDRQIKLRPDEPLLRFHVGPYSPDRREALELAGQWLQSLDLSGQVDVVSLGTSQLTQERFGQDWHEAPNGGGVPIATAEEFAALKAAAGGMLVRAYSGTSNVAEYARMLESSIDNGWHALSFWWFNRLDGRGPLSLRQGLEQHLQATSVAASHDKPFEPNIAHHFAFRGGDDVSGIVAVVLAVEAAVARGIRTVVLQVMLNTPRLTSGVADISKVRALLTMLSPLRRRGVRVLLQPRAGLSYFSSDLNRARAQLVASTALMADLTQGDPDALRIIHVVSYSEAVRLADPPIINESARLVRSALRSYREEGVSAQLINSSVADAITLRQRHLVSESQKMLLHARKHITGLREASGLYEVMRRGYFAVPQLWNCREEFSLATDWETRVVRGGVEVVDQSGRALTAEHRIERIESRPLGVAK